MSKRFAAFAALMTLASTAAFAQIATAPYVVIGSLPDGAPVYAIVGAGAAQPMPIAAYPGQNMRTVVPPMQINVPITTATGLTVPAGATQVIIQANGTNGTNGHCLRWRDDGVDPVAGSGISMVNGEKLTYSVVGFPIKFIVSAGATCTFTAAYYK